jgi:hypothetical protein
MLKSIVAFSFLFALTFAYGEASAESPNASNLKPDDFEVPETQFEKLQQLDEFNNQIDLYKKEIEEWKSFRNNIENAYSFSISNHNISILNDIVDKLKVAIENTLKSRNNTKLYEEQIKLEQELISRVESLIPIQLRYRFDWYQTMESRDVRSEIQQFQLVSQDIINRITKDGFYLNQAVTGGPIGPGSVIFKNTAELEAYIEIVKKAIEKDLSTHLSGIVKRIDDKIITSEKKIDDAKKNINKIYQDDDKKYSINSLAIWVGLPAFCLTILLLYLLPQWLIRNQPNKNHDYSSLLQLITVFLLTMTILILGLSGLISGEVLGTLIGGISGYVLNKTVNAARNTPTNQ